MQFCASYLLAGNTHSELSLTLTGQTETPVERTKPNSETFELKHSHHAQILYTNIIYILLVSLRWNATDLLPGSSLAGGYVTYLTATAPSWHLHPSSHCLTPVRWPVSLCPALVQRGAAVVLSAAH